MAVETIFAVSTAPGRSGVAVVRVSGPKAWHGYDVMTKQHQRPQPRQAATRKLYDTKSGEIIDHAMVIGFVGPHSFTGEDVVEYHVHGGTAIIRGLLDSLSTLPQHRFALPGEFTRRAFENGKMDLTAAEAIADLIHAETESQRLQALRQMDGALFHLYEGWKERLARLLALMEADLDFSDQDLPDDLLLKVRPDISDIQSDIKRHLDDGRRGEMLRDGFKIVILGAPNAGKSSLLNVLAQRDAAIVSPIAGTTRDMIDVHLNLKGYPVLVTDTAGLRQNELLEVNDSIEVEGIRRALTRADQADLKILLFDGTKEPDVETLNLCDDKSLVVLNKADDPKFNPALWAKITNYKISVQTGDGIDLLIATIGRYLENTFQSSDAPVLTKARHREAVQKTYDALARMIVAPLPELAAEDLRLAIRHLGSLTGRVDVEDLLDMIFRDFCIGK